MTIHNLQSFFDKLRIESYSFDLTDNSQHSQAGSGALYVSSSGPRLWQGSVSCSAHSWEMQRQLEATIQRVNRAGQFFDFTPPNGQFAANDPNGTILTSVTIPNPVAGYSATLAGLPRSFVLKEGDYFSILINGANRLFQIAMDATAGTQGNATVQLVNPILATNLPAKSSVVTLIRPRVTCQIMPKSFKTGSVTISSQSGAEFDFIEAVRPF